MHFAFSIKIFVKMKRLIIAIVIMFLNGYPCLADQDIVIDKDSVTLKIVPPQDFQQEQWLFCNLNDMSLYWTSHMGQCQDITLEYDTIPITVARGADEIYFKGLVAWSSYSRSTNGSVSDNIKVPDAWVKASCSGDKIIFEENQLSCEFKYAGHSYELYMKPSVIWHDMYHGTNTDISDTESRSLSSDLILAGALKNDSIEFRIEGNDFNPMSYWGDGKFKGLSLYSDSETYRVSGYMYQWEPYLTREVYGGKGWGIYADVMLINPNPSGNIKGVMSDPSTEGPYYDLQGRKYDKKPQQPGIYIHGNIKILIK